MLFSPTAAAVDRQLMTALAATRRKADRLKDEQVAADAAMRALELSPPPPNKLARHIKLYGNEGVEEVVRAFPTDSLPLSAYRTTAPKGTPADGRDGACGEDVPHERSPVSALANTLNISERRVKEVHPFRSDSGKSPRAGNGVVNPHG